MAIAAIEGVVENGRIRLRDGVSLPDKTRVYVVVPDMQHTLPRVSSPHLAHPEQATDFVKQVLEVPHDADL